MKQKKNLMWASLIHLSPNWAYDAHDSHCEGTRAWEVPGSPKLLFDRRVWDDNITRLKDNGTNTLIIDLGDGVVYDSHPEIALEGAWTKDELRQEIHRLQGMGFELIPKMNFSTCHDVWLGEYAKMISTDTYYGVCYDLIDEMCELFQPRFFHIGFDEEEFEGQQRYNYAVMRQHDLWWEDLYRFVGRVERNNVRTMMWSDYARERPDEYVRKCPKTVVQCNWYYFLQFSKRLSHTNFIRVRPFELFEKHGFDQLPGGSSCYFRDNFKMLVDYCKDRISPEHLLGFLQTSWEIPVPEKEHYLIESAETIGEARKLYYGK